MTQITIGFSKPKKLSLYARAIMLVFDIPFDHVYIKLQSNIYQRELIYQASKLMVNFMGHDLWLVDNIVIAEFPITMPDEQYVKMMQFCIDNAGRPYGILEALGMGLVRIAELCGKTIKNPFADGGKTYVCSELAGYVIETYAGKDIPVDLDNMNPLAVYKYLTSIQKA